MIQGPLPWKGGDGKRLSFFETSRDEGKTKNRGRKEELEKGKKKMKMGMKTT
jgi:hypothetical protein